MCARSAHLICWREIDHPVDTANHEPRTQGHYARHAKGGWWLGEEEGHESPNEKKEEEKTTIVYHHYLYIKFARFLRAAFAFFLLNDNAFAADDMWQAGRRRQSDGRTMLSEDKRNRPLRNVVREYVRVDEGGKRWSFLSFFAVGIYLTNMLHRCRAGYF